MKTTITVGIAEDHALVRDATVEWIHERTPHKVIIEAANGTELIDKIAALQTPPDVCLIDISMPVLNGYETTEMLRSLYPEMKLLALTSFNDKYCFITMIQNGINGFVMKFSRIGDLGNAISTVYTDGYYYSRDASAKLFSSVKNNKLPEFNVRELDFIGHCCSGLSFDQIANKMFVSKRTVDGYQASVNLKLNIHSRHELELFAVRTGLAPINNDAIIE